jgi:8-oxo-dGTP diphosphatase
MEALLMIEYTLGFALDLENQKVALIRKNRPEWQAGKLNGIGGHIEEGENPKEAQVREFYEETGVGTFLSDWNFVCRMDREEDNFSCFVFRTFNIPLKLLANITDENIEIHETKNINELYRNGECLSNIPWLVYMCLDLNPGGKRYYISGTIG